MPSLAGACPGHIRLCLRHLQGRHFPVTAVCMCVYLGDRGNKQQSKPPKARGGGKGCSDVLRQATWDRRPGAPKAVDWPTGKERFLYPLAKKLNPGLPRFEVKGSRPGARQGRVLARS
jgi:hypothetical protein